MLSHGECFQQVLTSWLFSERLTGQIVTISSPPHLSVYKFHKWTYISEVAAMQEHAMIIMHSYTMPLTTNLISVPNQFSIALQHMHATERVGPGN